MAKQLIGIGSTANDGTGDNLRAGATKVNNLINELYTTLGDGTNFSSGTFLTTSATQTVTNKTISGADNTVTNIPNSSLANSALSIKDSTSTIKTIDLGGTLEILGGSGINAVLSGSNVLTLTTDGAVVTETSTDTLTNKTINFANNTITGTANEFNTAVSDGSFSTTSGSETLTNKTIDLTDNTLTGTLAELNTAISDESVVGRATTDTLTNKTLTSPVINTTLTGTAALDLTGAGSKFKANFANTAALPDATTYTGMFATKTDSSEAFYSESGAWIKLFSENNTIQDISNVIITGIADGHVLKWNASTTRFESAAESGGITAGSDIDMAGAQLQDAGYISHRSPDSTVVHTLTITVATKTSEHHAFGDGSSSGYVIDGDQSPFLTLAPGVYKFDQAAGTNAGHPLRFYIDAAKTTEYTYGVTNSGTPGNAGAYTQIVVDENTMGTLYYQCTAHANMGHALTTPGGRKHTKTSMTGDGSDTTLTIEAGRTVDNVLV
ncbi:MAG: hypothetical protein ACKVJK_17375, partial [Methylophagaceae bacterium]